jgi:4-cresol dehydrogenase (hydroxylating)
MGPAADHVRHLGGLRVILADGALLETGWAAFEGARCAGVDDVGPGLDLGALFIQSSLGVVISGSVRLGRTPERTVLGIIAFADDASLLAVAADLREWKLRGLVQAGPRIDNVYRMLQQEARVAELVGEARHLPVEEAAALARSRGLGRWRVLLTLAGDEPIVRASADRLADLAAASGLEIRLLGLGDEPRTTSETLLLATARGEPAQVGLRRLYWRKPANVPAGDPEVDGCGFIFATTVLPFTASAIAEVQTIVATTVSAGGFEPELSLLALHDRVLHGHMSISYDRLLHGEDDRARATHGRLLETLADRGYHPYRLGIQSMAHLRRLSAPAQSVLQRLKGALDPAGVIAPGRYTVR